MQRLAAAIAVRRVGQPMRRWRRLGERLTIAQFVSGHTGHKSRTVLLLDFPAASDQFTPMQARLLR
jgi:hypothetical protein